jgi:hypothetical protein
MYWQRIRIGRGVRTSAITTKALSERICRIDLSSAL